MEPIIEFRDLSFQYNAQASPTLKNIELSIRKREKVLIAGPSGCGKSTLIHCINGLIPFSYKGTMTGEVLVKGKPTKEQSVFDISHTVGTVLQDLDGQFIGLTVAEDIAFALENEAVEEPELHERVRKAAELVNISSHMDFSPGELSGGQKQRVSLAGVMVEDVDVLLFDEPLANLDPATGKKTMELIDDIGRQTGAAIIIIEHRLEDVLWRHVDRIVLMGEGRILADTSPDELLSGELLKENGIREPLYLTALKYAGVKISPEMKPRSIRTIRLSEEDRRKVSEWYESRKAPEPEEEKIPVLEVRDLSFAYAGERKGFAVPALEHISAKLYRGELLAIVGQNGAGKSTLSKVICGFETLQEGTVLLNGEDMAGLSIKERADHVGYVMQNPNQMISQNLIYDEIALGLRKRGIGEEEIRERVEETLKVCGLWKFRSWPISALSYGQKKRVTIASILVLRPEVIILDEPTAGQDYRHYTDIMEFLVAMNRRGITIVMITHDMHLMLEYARRTLVLCERKLLADTTGAVVLTSPELIKAADLKETSLYDLAALCGIEDAAGYVQCFIDYERQEVRS
ncbi:MAG: ABC transporter ATP-binding protein [Lachnospiraceae bacterium]|nr:ABC transporter ATP-binding protein [Lachnospiraceae bacterium]